jgi:rubrerythrin
MDSECQKAIEKARKLEIDGAEFYTKVAKRCNVPPGRRMFESFASDERRHLRVIEEVVKGLGVDLDKMPMPRDEIRTIFSEAERKGVADMGISAGQQEAVRVAMGMETESYKLYADAAVKATDGLMRKLFERLAREENQHYEMLENTLEYLQSNKEWFLWKEWALITGDQSSLGAE